MMWKINYNYKDAPEKPIDYGYEKWKKANRTTFDEVSIPEGYVQLDSGTLVRKEIAEKMNKK